MVFALGSDLDPFQALWNLQRRLERTLDQPAGGFGLSGRGAFPPLNAFEDDDGGVVIRCEMPGVDPASVEIGSRGQTLTISGRRELPRPANGSYHRRERAAGEFSRSLQVPADLDLSRAEASCRCGMLTVRLPKREEAKPRQIRVQTS